MEKSLVQSSKNNNILIANYMIQHATLNGKHFAYSDKEKMLYRYDGKIYEPYEKMDLDKFFHDFMIEYEVTDIWKSSRLSEIERAMKVNDLVPRVEMDNYDNLICFKNCILDMKTMEILAHSHTYFFSTYVNVDYEPSSGDEPEVFLEAMQKIFYNAAKKSPDYSIIDSVQRMGGALIFPKNKLRQLYIFLGGGSNGKSILMNVFKMFFPPEFTTYLSLEELSTKNLERSRLLKSRVNFCTEEKGGAIGSEEIKKIVYGEGVTVRRKNKEAVEFIPRTKIVLACNSKPFFNDTSYGLERRLTIVSFENMFLPFSKYNRIKNPEQQGVFLAEDDDELMAKLEKERTQILNFFLLGLKKLVEEDWQMPDSEAIQETKREYLESNDTVGTWLKENFKINENGAGPSDSILVSDILIEYREWYRENVSTRPLNYATSTMGSKIADVFRIKAIRKCVVGRRMSAYKLIKEYHSNYDNEDETTSEGGIILDNEGE